MTNTFAKGRVRVLVYKERDQDIWYATVLEFNLTVDGHDKSEVIIEIQQAIKDYAASARELNDERLLNQDPDPELLLLWNSATSPQGSELIKSPYIPFSASVESLTESF
jgi:hypothetical protein